MVMTFASVSMILPRHCGHAVGRGTGFVNCVFNIILPCRLSAMIRDDEARVCAVVNNYSH